MMDDLACPKCKTTLYRNPNMKLMVNVCGHNLCEDCVELLFVKGSGACPECAIPLRRTNFRLQLFEDAAIDKEVDIRKRLLRDFNKKEEDFDSLNDYNDYLEMVEDLIFNLNNNIDILETNKKIAAYKEANKNFISKNRHRMSKESIELADLMAEEARLGHVRSREVQKEEEDQKKLKAKNKEKLIDDLMFSEADAATIVSEHAKAAQAEEEEAFGHARRPKFSTGLDMQNMEAGASGAPAAVAAAPAPAVQFVYHPPDPCVNGPEPPSEQELVSGKYVKNVRAADDSVKAGGFRENIACMRALQEAMCDLFYAK